MPWFRATPLERLARAPRPSSPLATWVANWDLEGTLKLGAVAGAVVALGAFFKTVLNEASWLGQLHGMEQMGVFALTVPAGGVLGTLAVLALVRAAQPFSSTPADPAVLEDLARRAAKHPDLREGMDRLAATRAAIGFSAWDQARLKALVDRCDREKASQDARLAGLEAFDRPTGAVGRARAKEREAQLETRLPPLPPRSPPRL